MEELIEDCKWHSSPTLNYSVEYESERPNRYSKEVRVRFRVKMRSIYSDCNFPYPLYFKNSINNREYTVTDSFGRGIKSVTYTTPWISFEEAGNSKRVGITPRCGDGSHTSYNEGTITFPSYISKPSVTIDSITDIGLDTFKVNYSYSGDFKQLEYSLNNGSWIKTTARPLIINNLTPNTEYNIKIRGISSQGEAGDSKTSSTKTLDVAKFVTLDDFVFGESVNIAITNPSESNVTLRIIEPNTDTQIKKIENLGDTKKIEFTQEELDLIYQLIKDNKIIIRFILEIKQWSSYKDVCCFFDGNAKTVNININNTNKRAKIWIKINGTWKKAIAHIKIDRDWKKTK